MNINSFPDPEFYPDFRKAYDFLKENGFEFEKKGSYLSMIMAKGWSIISGVTEEAHFFLNPQRVVQFKVEYIYDTNCLKVDFVDTIDTHKYGITYPIPNFYKINHMGQMVLDNSHPQVFTIMQIRNLIGSYCVYKYSDYSLFINLSKAQERVKQILHLQRSLIEDQIKYYREKIDLSFLDYPDLGNNTEFIKTFLYSTLEEFHQFIYKKFIDSFPKIDCRYKYKFLDSFIEEESKMEMPTFIVRIRNNFDTDWNNKKYEELLEYVPPFDLNTCFLGGS